MYTYAVVKIIQRNPFTCTQFSLMGTFCKTESNITTRRLTLIASTELTLILSVLYVFVCVCVCRSMQFHVDRFLDPPARPAYGTVLLLQGPLVSFC